MSSYQDTMLHPRKPRSWWIEKVPEKRERLRFSESLKDFLSNISLHGYAKLVEEKKGFREKMIWFVFHIMTLALLILFLKYTITEFFGQHLHVTLYDPLYPIEKIPFPTVSICSINRISNASALEYATELSNRDPRRRKPEYFYSNIKMLAYLFQSGDVMDLDRALYFQGFLDLYDTDDDEVFFNTSKTMQLLSPSCKDILKECHLGGKIIDCFTEFEIGLTKYGYCCTFNSKNKYRIRSDKMRFFGSTQGLSVTLRSLSNDTFYNVLETDGFIVLIHPHSLYADVSSGGVSERFIPSQQDSYMSIAPRFTDSVPSIRHYSPKLMSRKQHGLHRPPNHPRELKTLFFERIELFTVHHEKPCVVLRLLNLCGERACYFDDELPNMYGEHYSLNRCITQCRIRSIIVLCECLPFYYPYHFLDTNTEIVHCTLQHLECLNRYEFKWMNVITQRQTVRGLEREMEDGLYCPECLPSCSDIQYKVSLMSLPLDRFRYGGGRVHNITDITKLQLYFAEPTVPFYRQIIKNSWFEVFSTVGNICGIVTGFSLVAVCEILYFVGGKIMVFLWDTLMADRIKGDMEKQKLIICP